MKKNNIKPNKLIIKTKEIKEESKEEPKEEIKEKKKLIIKPKKKLIIKTITISKVKEDESICKLKTEDFKNSYCYFEAVCKWLNLPVFHYTTMSMSYPSIIVPAYKNLDNKIRKHFKIDINIDVLKCCKIAIHPTFAVNDQTFQYKHFYESNIDKEFFEVKALNHLYYVSKDVKDSLERTNPMEHEIILRNEKIIKS